jgi:hypothetical protein
MGQTGLSKSTLHTPPSPPGNITKTGGRSPKSRAFERYNALTSNRDTVL